MESNEGLVLIDTVLFFAAKIRNMLPKNCHQDRKGGVAASFIFAAQENHARSNFQKCIACFELINIVQHLLIDICNKITFTL
jgi:hypothetical protein